MNTLLFDRAPGRAALGRALTPGYQTTQVRHTADPYALSFGEFRQVQVVRENAACWKNYERTPNTEEGTEGSCRPKGSNEKKKKKRKKKGSKMHKARENASKFPKKGSDADGDGKYNEGKKKISDFSDKDGNGKVDAFEKSSSSEYDSESESDGGGK